MKSYFSQIKIKVFQFGFTFLLLLAYSNLKAAEPGSFSGNRDFHVLDDYWTNPAYIDGVSKIFQLDLMGGLGAGRYAIFDLYANLNLTIPRTNFSIRAGYFMNTDIIYNFYGDRASFLGLAYKHKFSEDFTARVGIDWFHNNASLGSVTTTPINEDSEELMDASDKMNSSLIGVGLDYKKFRFGICTEILYNRTITEHWYIPPPWLKESNRLYEENPGIWKLYFFARYNFELTKGIILSPELNYLGSGPGAQIRLRFSKFLALNIQAVAEDFDFRNKGTISLGLIIAPDQIGSLMLSRGNGLHAHFTIRY